VALVIYMIGSLLVKVVDKVLASTLDRRKVDDTIKGFLKSIVHTVLIILLLITVVSALGVNTTSFAALLASAGVAVGMALSGNLQNFAGGVCILLLKPFKNGDYIEAQGQSGVVKKIEIFHTLIMTTDNKLIYLPNGALSSGNITNYSSEPQRRVDLTIGVEYGEDVEKVKTALYELIASDKRVLQDGGKEPFVAVSSLSASSVDFTVRMWVEGANYWGVFFDMQELIYTEFNKRGIGFPFPQLTVHQGK
ncbi:MAG: mechanosensitive ion channel, partial [Bacteroidaceae bacterium]|nr:mechanosensitive ion channel [Bacteroidaceae bacterium]